MPDAPPAIEPEELPDVEPVPPAVDPVVPAPVEPVPPGVDPAPVEPGPDVDPAPVEPGPDVEPVAPALDPVEPAPLGEEEPIAPLPAAPLERLALVSMKLPAAPDALPLVPVAPEVPVCAPDAVLPAPEPEVRHPVATTVCPWLEPPLMLPVCPCVPLGVCAAAPAPSATAIIVPKRNCRFITSSVLGE